jgi:hypothetical protein
MPIISSMKGTVDIYFTIKCMTKPIKDVATNLDLKALHILVVTLGKKLVTAKEFRQIRLKNWS